MNIKLRKYNFIVIVNHGIFRRNKSNELISKNKKNQCNAPKAAGKAVNFKEMAESLSEVIEANVFVVSRREITWHRSKSAN